MSNIEKIIFKYLDVKKFFIKEDDDNYYFLLDEKDELSQIVVRKYDKRCWYYYELLDEMITFFSYYEIDYKEVLIKYVEDILNLSISESFNVVYNLPRLRVE